MFSADLSWTDQHDQINKENRGRGRSGKSHVSSETSLPPNHKIVATKEVESTKSSFFFRRKRPGSPRSSDSSSRPSTGTGTYTHSSGLGEDKFGLLPQNFVRNVGSNEVNLPPALHSAMRVKSADDITELPTRQSAKYEPQSSPGKASPRESLRNLEKPSYALVELDGTEEQYSPPRHRPVSSKSDASSQVLKSVTIAVQYSSLEEDRAFLKNYGTGCDARVWKGTEDENSLCLGLSGTRKVTLVGTKCSAPHNSDSLLNHTPQCFQNLMKVMEVASSKTSLKQLQLVRGPSTNSMTLDEMELEYQLWTSTLVDRRILKKRFSTWAKPAEPTVSYNKMEILDLDGTIGDLYRMAHNHPGSRLLHLTNGKNAKNQNLLPTTVTQTLVDLNGNGGRSEFLLPYVNESMDMIYMSRPAILLPASQIPNLLRDCYRILKPGGAVKLRLIDAMPDQQSAGPDLSEWIDTHLLETLEQESRISQPSLRVPIWAKLAGFVVPEIPEKTICLPGVISCDEEATTVIGAKVAQDIWKASWGMFVRQGNSYCQTFWWEEPEIVQECITLGTTWTITTLLLTKIRR